MRSNYYRKFVLFFTRNQKRVKLKYFNLLLKCDRINKERLYLLWLENNWSFWFLMKNNTAVLFFKTNQIGIKIKSYNLFYYYSTNKERFIFLWETSKLIKRNFNFFFIWFIQCNWINKEGLYLILGDIKINEFKRFQFDSNSVIYLNMIQSIHSYTK